MRKILGALIAAFASSAAPFGAALAADAALIREGRAAAKVCQACHDFHHEKRKFGPHLVQVLGRPVASVALYPYSAGLKGLGGIWTEDRLANFVNDPAGYAPGVAMNFEGFHDMAKARAVVAYLAAQAKQ
mgnify:CR=1 FL=1